jgi:hypothetical protein
MAKEYRCPACQNEVNGAAVVCSNPACRKDLAFCSHCHDVTTYVLVEKGSGRFGRDRYRCQRCERIGSKCLTWAAGGYCNGLARTGGRWDQPLCATCNDRLSDLSRTVVGWTLIGAFGGMLKPKK